jgi:peptidyl-tRNA hydrolase
MISYVIGYISENELKELDSGVEIAKEAVMEILKNGADFAMNKYNKKKDV